METANRTSASLSTPEIDLFDQTSAVWGAVGDAIAEYRAAGGADERLTGRLSALNAAVNAAVTAALDDLRALGYHGYFEAPE